MSYRLLFMGSVGFLSTAILLFWLLKYWRWVVYRWMVLTSVFVVFMHGVVWFGGGLGVYTVAERSQILGWSSWVLLLLPVLFAGYITRWFQDG